MHRWRRVLDRMKDADIQGFFFSTLWTLAVMYVCCVHTVEVCLFLGECVSQRHGVQMLT